MRDNVEEIKSFNRFYLRMIGLFNLYTDKSLYSATEAMILFDIYSKDECTASFLSEYYMFDKGYISRILKKFEKRNLIKKVPSIKDRRVQLLYMTEEGEQVLDDLRRKADSHVERMIRTIKPGDSDELIASMKKIVNILEQK